jgi:hypothetical protein
VAGTAAVAVDGTAVEDGAVAVFEADTTDAATTAGAGTGMLATIDGTAAGAGGVEGTTRGGYFRFRGLTHITVITDQGTDTGMDRDTGMDTDTESGSVIFTGLLLDLLGKVVRYRAASASSSPICRSRCTAAG